MTYYPQNEREEQIAYDMEQQGIRKLAEQRGAGPSPAPTRAKQGLYSTLSTCHPSLTRGQVWCHTCGHTQRVDSAECFRSGWPMHCGETMSIDSPRERQKKKESQ